MAGHRFNPEKADKLIDPSREQLVSPSKMAKILGIKEDDIIADLGAGNGFFALPFAKMTKEKLIAVDIEPLMLVKLKERAEAAGINNIDYVKSSLEDLILENESVDKVITALVLHEVSNLDHVLSNIYQILKPNGTALIIDWEKVETESGPPLHERISSEDMSKAIKKLPVIIIETFKINDSQYGVLLKKRED